MKLGRSIVPQFLIGVVAVGFLTLSVPETASAESVCKVTDPTGTPLNVRDRPNGKKINALRNGREVEVLETGRDAKGRPWVKIGGDYKGEYRVWGWVFREFISCYDR